MGTKLKNFNRQPGMKALVYSLVVLMMIGFAVQAAALIYANETGALDLEKLYVDRYENSGEIWEDAYQISKQILETNRRVPARDSQKPALAGEGIAAVNETPARSAENAAEGVFAEPGGALPEGIFYVLRRNGGIVSHVSDESVRPVVVFMSSMDGTQTELWYPYWTESSENTQAVNFILEENPNYELYVLMTEVFIAEKQAQWAAQNRIFLPYLILGALEVILFVLLLVWAACVAGRRPAYSRAPLSGRPASNQALSSGEGSEALLSSGDEGSEAKVSADEDAEGYTSAAGGLAAACPQGKEPVYLSRLDRIYTDILLLLGICAAAFWCAMAVMGVSGANPYSGYDVSAGAVPAALESLGSMQIMYIVCAVFMTAAMAVLFLVVYLSLIRRIKARILFSHTLIAAVCYRWLWKKVWCQWIWNKVLYRRIWHGFFGSAARLVKRGFAGLAELADGSRFKRYPFARHMLRRHMGYMAVQGALNVLMLFVSVLFFYDYGLGLALVLLAVSLMLGVKYAGNSKRLFEDMTKLCDQIREVNSGDLLYLPQMETSSPLYESRKLLAKIGSGMQSSVDQAVKSERMKVDLITNVSHDIKTPLTSIISYIDLLSKEEGLSPEARDYVSILSQKSDRLRHIVSDLFDLAKTTSGNAEINLEKLDFKMLIEQTIADMEDHFAGSGRHLRVRLPEEPVMIRGDGKKLYRVLQNILDNALKYSQEGSRIYVELDQKNGKAYAAVKNMAAHEIDFTAEEVMERFSRGDKSRSTEGSGLGLSIAESFTKASGGSFAVAVDGDLFKVCMEFDTIA